MGEVQSPISLKLHVVSTTMNESFTPDFLYAILRETLIQEKNGA
ncbi:MAG: hypothetical protein ACI4DN_11380 [Lachnospiraceae bacterium]